MNEVNRIIQDLEFCDSMFYYTLTPDDSRLLLGYIQELQQENQQLKEIISGKKSSIKALKIALKERTDERDNHYDKEHLYKSVLDEIREYIKEHKEYLEKAKEMYIGCNDELLKSTCIQLINNELVRSDKLLQILDKAGSNE